LSENDDDLTKLTDLSEFEHELDQATEDYFQKKSEENNPKQDDENEDFDEDDSLNDEDSFPEESWGDEVSEEPEADSSIIETTSLQEDHTEEPPLSNEDLTITDWNEFEEEEESDDAFLEQEELIEPSISTTQNEITEETQKEFSDPVTQEGSSSIEPEVHKELQELETIFDPILNFDASSEGNPPFSILIEEIQEPEIQKLLELLEKYSLIQGNQKESLERIQKGEYLIPRISEFACITITRELKHYPFKLTIGPSDKVFSSSFYTDPHPGGLPTFENIDHNQNAHIKIGKEDDKS